ncbi:hypothetical protein BCR42DRAFT_471864 [Absidia repens]|uniref:G-protein coupled receptors family 1 profile domain-containing protein n=1 Tax=Absidia repens TaxID=90262 RepID=A0A1X2I3L1_9FUNG|nr:hypothetical protein BCR42DRAFT_471864 [Absidia repens]
MAEGIPHVVYDTSIKLMSVVLNISSRHQGHPYLIPAGFGNFSLGTYMYNRHAESKIIETMQELLEEEPYSVGVITNPQFRFNNDQYRQLEIATITCGSISVVAAMSVLSMYTYLLIYYPRDANRVSLHCVIASIIFSLVDHCFNLAALRTDINSSFCDSFRAIDGFVTLASSCLLGMVGVHLLLVFYFHVRRWPCRPEYILIPIAVVYAVVGNILGYVWNNVPEDFHTIYLQLPHLCWYYSNFIDRLYNSTAWIYYYSFVFFIIVVSLSCSLIAMRRVYMDKAENQARLLKIAARNTGNTSPISVISKGRGNGAVKNLVARSIQDHPDSFSKIVIRSLLYPLTPCLVYIWGFGLQMYLVQSDHHASFGIAMMNVIMTRLEGFFIAGIFFMDPTVHKIQKELWTNFKAFICCHQRRPSVPAPTIRTTPADKPGPVSIPSPHTTISSSGVAQPEPLLLSPGSIMFLDHDSRHSLD